MKPIHFMRGPRGQTLEPLCGIPDGHEGTTEREDVDCWRCAHLLLGRPLPAEPARAEHDRLAAAKQRDATQLLGEFVVWLTQDQGLTIARHSCGKLVPCGTPPLRLVADFLGISQEALEAEKRAILDYVRAVNAAQEWAASEGRRALGAD